MPHTDTNISRDALRSYGMQPTRRQEYVRQENRRKESGRREDRLQKQNTEQESRFRVYGDCGDINPSKVYVDVLAEFTRDGFLRPCRITWEDGRKYMIDRVKGCERRASRKAGGMGLMYTCMIGGQEVNLFYEENQRWFVTRK